MRMINHEVVPPPLRNIIDLLKSVPLPCPSQGHGLVRAGSWWSRKMTSAALVFAKVPAPGDPGHPSPKRGGRRSDSCRGHLADPANAGFWLVRIATVWARVSRLVAGPKAAAGCVQSVDARPWGPSFVCLYHCPLCDESAVKDQWWTVAQPRHGWSCPTNPTAQQRHPQARNHGSCFPGTSARQSLIGRWIRRGNTSGCRWVCPGMRPVRGRDFR